MVLTILLTVIHVIVCLFLMIVVLLQSGKAADLAGAFGGMGSQTVFGPRGAATVLSKATTIAAALFMVTSLSLSLLSSRAGSEGGSRSVLESTKDPAAQPAGQAPQGQPPAGQPGMAMPPPPGQQPKVELFNEQGQKVGEQDIQLPPPNAAGQPKQPQQQQKK